MDSRLWHVSDPTDNEWDEEAEQSGGYVVLAKTQAEAIALVVDREHREFLDYCAEKGKEPSVDLERWYHVGISKKEWPTPWAVRPVDSPYRIPFLGYSW